MALTSGTKLGPYEIHSPLGAGGMGEVYRARDTRLDRDVAVKVLPSNLSSDPNLRQRLEREAKAVSKLSHPNICTLHDIGHQDGIDYLVMELVEGETLEQRLTKGPLPTEQTIRYSAQIADALAKAHKLGFTHRDLKPANIMLTKVGAKLMDFGLAKQSGPAPLAQALTEMTMEQSKLTGEGTIVGTFQYMAPEQLEGKEADARTDIFALGEVMYEMATAQPAFSGKSRASLIASILTTEPPPITQLQPFSPLVLERVVKKCLAKDPDDRWQSASDLASELKWIAESGSQTGTAVVSVPRSNKRERLAWAVALVLTLAILAVMIAYKYRQVLPPRVEASLPAPEKSAFKLSGTSAGNPVISQDGQTVAFVAKDESDRQQIWVRALNESAAHPVPGSENAIFPFWAPDGKSLGFFADGKLKRIPLQGGTAHTLADASDGRGGSWSNHGAILFTPGINTAIYSVSEDGGAPIAVTKIDPGIHTSHRWPYFLADGKQFIYLAVSHNTPAGEQVGIYVGSLDGSENRKLLQTPGSAVAVPGYMLFLRGSTLMAQPFDADSARLKGEATVVTDNVGWDADTWRAIFDSSRTGILVFLRAAASDQGSDLLWFNRDGKIIGKVGPRGEYRDLRLSPDGKRLAVSEGNLQSSIWMYDLTSGIHTRITFLDQAESPVWSPDGARIAFSLLSAGHADIYQKSVSGGGKEEPLFVSDSFKTVMDWSPDGRYLVYQQGTSGLQSQVWVLPMFGDRKPYLLLQEARSSSPQFSPDGRWLCYSSSVSGRQEVYVIDFPKAEGRWQVTSNGGGDCHWNRNGKEIFSQGGDDIFTALQVDTANGKFQLGQASQLFRATSQNASGFTWDIAPDGKRVLANSPVEVKARNLSLLINWRTGLNK
jgi:serine/threonine protein kinase